MDVQERFWSKVDRSADCWLWTACTLRGYGIFGKQPIAGTHAHRIAYLWEHGALPPSLDHLCHPSDGSCQGGSQCIHRRCVRPSHLAPATTQRNVLRGVGPTALNAAKTHCHNGHALTPENLYIKKHGRECRQCARERYLNRSVGVVTRPRGAGVGGRKRTRFQYGHDSFQNSAAV